MIDVLGVMRVFFLDLLDPTRNLIVPLLESFLNLWRHVNGIIHPELAEAHELEKAKARNIVGVVDPLFELKILRPLLSNVAIADSGAEGFSSRVEGPESDIDPWWRFDRI